MLSCETRSWCVNSLVPWEEIIQKRTKNKRLQIIEKSRDTPQTGCFSKAVTFSYSQGTLPGLWPICGGLTWFSTVFPSFFCFSAKILMTLAHYMHHNPFQLYIRSRTVSSSYWWKQAQTGGVWCLMPSVLLQSTTLPLCNHHFFASYSVDLGSSFVQPFSNILFTT